MNKFNILLCVLALNLSACKLNNQIEEFNSSSSPMSLVIQNVFYKAAVAGDTALIQKYLNLGYSIDAKNEYFMTALCEAKANGEENAYKILYKYGADENVNCMKNL